MQDWVSVPVRGPIVSVQTIVDPFGTKPLSVPSGVQTGGGKMVMTMAGDQDVTGVMVQPFVNVAQVAVIGPTSCPALQV